MANSHGIDKKVIQTDKAPQAIGPYSQAIRSGNLLFISGQISLDPTSGKINQFDGSVAKQCRLALANLNAILASENLTVDNVVKTTVYLKSMDDFLTMNAAYETYFQQSRPARATVAVSGLPGGVLFEIDAIAVYPS